MADIKQIAQVLTLIEALEIVLAKVRTEIFEETTTLERRNRLRTLSEIVDMNLQEEINGEGKFITRN